MRIAVLTANLYEEPELLYPYYRLLEEGHEVLRIGTEVATYTGKYGYPVRADLTSAEVDPADYDGVIIPGGFSPDYMRRDPAMVSFVAALVDAGKPAAAICHGPWMLVEADVVRGRRVTSVTAVRTDLRNAGGEWVDQAVVVDGPVITSRTPKDLPAFMKAFIDAL